MTTTSTGRASAALPTRLKTLLGAMFLLNVTGYAAIGAALQILLPTQIESVDPAGKLATFGLVTGVSAIASVCVPPLVGVMSDRTRSRWGRRSPWILYGGIATLAALVLLGWVTTVTGLLIGWFLVQGTINIGLNIMIAMVADRIPEQRRGLASTVTGLGLPVGLALGTALGAALVNTALFAYTLLGVLFAAASIILAVVGRESVPVNASRPALRLGAQLAAAANSLRTPDYAWAFASRAVIFLGYYTVSAFGLYILTDYIHLPLGLAAPAALATQSVIATVALVVGMAVAGPLADKLNRRKLFVLISSLLISISVMMPLLSPTWPVVLASAVVGGLGVGAYFAVDQALATLVLPAAEDSGRDLGIFHIALNAPQVIAPFAGSLIIGHLGGYPALYAISGILAIIGSLMILQVKSVR